MKRNCFLFREEWIDALASLDCGESQGGHFAFTTKQVIDAILRYALYGKTPSIEKGYNSREFDALFSLIARQIDEDVKMLCHKGILVEED